MQVSAPATGARDSVHPDVAVHLLLPQQSPERGARFRRAASPCSTSTPCATGSCFNGYSTCQSRGRHRHGHQQDGPRDSGVRGRRARAAQSVGDATVRVPRRARRGDSRLERPRRGATFGAAAADVAVIAGACVTTRRHAPRGGRAPGRGHRRAAGVARARDEGPEGGGSPDPAHVRLPPDRLGHPQPGVAERD